MVLQPRFVIPAYDGNAESEGHDHARTRHGDDEPHAAHARPRQGHDLHRALSDGRTRVLLSVPKYDFNWQITYELKTPKVLPKGTRSKVIAHYDNSRGNKFNPGSTKDVGGATRV
jgi:hypothetical protein